MPHRYWTLGFVSGPERTANNAATLEAGLTCRLHVVCAAEAGAARDEVHQGRRNAPALRCAPLPPRLEPRPVVQPSVPEWPLCLTCRVQSKAEQLCTLRQVTSGWLGNVVQSALLPASKLYIVTDPTVLAEDKVAKRALCKLPSNQSHAPAHAKGVFRGRHAYQGQPQAQRRREWPQKLPQPPGVHRCLSACTPHSWLPPQPRIPAAVIWQPQPGCLEITRMPE